MEETTFWLSRPPVAYLYLPQPLPLVVFVQVAHFGELLRLIGHTSFWRAAAGRMVLTLGRMLPEVVQRGGGGGGHVLGGAVL